MSITPEQAREARRLLGWSQEMVGGVAGLSQSSICKIENGNRFIQDEPRERVRAALEAAGVEFIADEGAGVRLRKARQ